MSDWLKTREELLDTIRDLRHEIRGLMTEQDALRESHARLRETVDSAGVLIMVLDAAGAIQSMNQRGRSLMGYKEYEIIGNMFWDHMPQGEARDELMLRYARMMAGEVRLADEPAETRIRTKAGGERLLECVFSLVFDDTGAVSGASVTGVDVTANKNAQSALRAGEEQLRRIVETANEGVWILNPAGLTTFVNAKLCEILGYSANELMDRPLEDFLMEESAARGRETIEACLGGSQCQADLRLAGGDGAGRWVILNAGPLSEPDGGRGMLAMVTDITARKAMEERLRQAQQMEALGRLTGGIAHHLNNLLTIILGEIELAEMKSPPEVKANLREARIGAGRAADVIMKLMAFSMKSLMEASIRDVNEIARRAAGELGELPYPAEFRYELDSGPLPARIDEAKIQAAIVEILRNAAEAVAGRIEGDKASGGLTGPYWIEISASATTTERREPAVAVRVSDNGSGMDDETRRRAFDPFFTTKDVGKGLGLGLTAAHGIVKQHRGSLRIDSRPGKGTTVLMVLPAGETAADAGEAESAAD